MSYTYPYPRPAVTVDALIFLRKNDNWNVLLIQRKNYPFEGLWAIPGGFMDMNETLIEAAYRELKEETGLENVVISQFYTFDAIDRDPRHRTISTIFVGFTDEKNCNAQASDDAIDAQWFKIDALPEMAFDHKMIIEKAVEWYL